MVLDGTFLTIKGPAIAPNREVNEITMLATPLLTSVLLKIVFETIGIKGAPQQKNRQARDVVTIEPLLYFLL
jgi:hypothetical protein